MLRAPRDFTLKQGPPKNKKQKNKGEFVNERLNAAMKGVSITGDAAATSTEDVAGATAAAPLDEITSEVTTPLEGVDPVPLALSDAAEPPATVLPDPYQPVKLPSVDEVKHPTRIPELNEPIQLTDAEAIEIAREVITTTGDINAGPDQFPEGAQSNPSAKQMYCPECYLPLHPDPIPEKLYIFLHALKYTTSLGSFETEMPEWSREGFTWDRGPLYYF